MRLITPPFPVSLRRPCSRSPAPAPRPYARLEHTMVAARRPETRWATRLIPLVLAGCVGFATYVVVKRICLDFYINDQKQPRTATIFLAFYFVFLFLMLAAYLRVFLVIQYNPGVVPVGPRAAQQKQHWNERPERSRRGNRARDDDVESIRYAASRDENPDSPGLEDFYSKDVFVCDFDGRPPWCSTCCNWKPDRAHHCSEIDRCVRKMDHYCPWVGGIIGETSFKFFVQFTFYTTLYCIIAISAGALCLKTLVESGAGVDGFVIGILGIGGFFGLFTFTMTLSAGRYILVNLTNVDYLKSKTLVHQLAIRVPRGTEPGIEYGVVTYPLPKPMSSPRLSGQTVTFEPLSERDQLALRTFAIVRTEIGENPWDLGSPCEGSETSESFYEMGPLYHELRTRFRLPELSEEKKESIPRGRQGEWEMAAVEKQRERRRQQQQPPQPHREHGPQSSSGS
ncbi:DHHC palmitoyltransferase-domain-containing protein [Podospora appendiculata]|uniref:Palmitoyltransferase n=1 Tax=Podospora appendiculata TaxID=314037 RepID=A0AAE1CIA6_9PEZI|nr:DHHC palmitoyltransferase-domain-containing protein [Podospora appendiculata]